MSANVFKYRTLFYTLITNTCVKNAARRSVYARIMPKRFPHGKNSNGFNRLYKTPISSLQTRMHCTVGVETSPAVTFDDERVEELLKRMTGKDFDKIFAIRVEELEVPKYQLMSDDQLQEARKEMDEMADALLRMPSQLAQREEDGQFISKDEQLKDFDDCCYVFTDIAMGNNDETRHIVVRETDGTLRRARWSERDRMNQTYFPKKGRQMIFPSLLKDENLPTVFDQLRHTDVLDLVCIQCPPDSADYIRVHKRTHADLLWRENYETLYSTRHYGPYLWFLASRHQLEGILKFFLTTDKESSAVDIIKLHHLMFPKMTSAVECTKLNITGIGMIKNFCESMNYHGILELLEKNREEHQESDAVNETNTKQSATS